MIKHIDNQSEFEETIKNGLSVVDFFATWCGPCRMLSPILENASEKHSDVSFCKVDVDENYELAKSFGIMSVPTILIFKDGSLVDKSIGLISLDKISEIVEKNR